MASECDSCMLPSLSRPCLTDPHVLSSSVARGDHCLHYYFFSFILINSRPDDLLPLSIFLPTLHLHFFQEKKIKSSWFYTYMMSFKLKHISSWPKSLHACVYCGIKYSSNSACFISNHSCSFFFIQKALPCSAEELTKLWIGNGIFCHC